MVFGCLTLASFLDPTIEYLVKPWSLIKLIGKLLLILRFLTEVLEQLRSRCSMPFKVGYFNWPGKQRGVGVGVGVKARKLLDVSRSA